MNDIIMNLFSLKGIHDILKAIKLISSQLMVKITNNKLLNVHEYQPRTLIRNKHKNYFEIK